MNKRIAKALLAVIASVAVLIVVGVVAYHFGSASGNDGRHIVGPMMRERGYVGFGDWGPGGVIPLVLIGVVVVWLVAMLVGGSGRSSGNAPAGTPPAAAPGGWPATPPLAAPLAPTTTGDGLERLKELSDLHDRDALTDEEFGAAKRKLLGL